MSCDDGNLVLKYFDLLDEFVRVRILAEGDVGRLGGRQVHNKAEYRRAVIDHCLPDVQGDMARRLESLGEDYDAFTIEDLLYQVCIDVNPNLEIHQVSLPAQPAAEPAAERARGRGSLVPKNIQNLEKTLRRRIVGQDLAVEQLAKAVKKSAIGLKRPTAPVGTFFLVGRTGTGKTEIAKALVEALFGTTRSLVRVDCTEYALPHEYAKLIGSPPGYIGHAEGGYLTESVKSRKQCVVLFDEVEKAHAKVHNLLLQILDEGMLTDSKGETVSFTESIILLTSNLGIEQIDRVRGRMGFDCHKRTLLSDIDHAAITQEALRENFRPEFLNRIDEVIVFNPLDVEVCSRIAARMLGDIAALLGERGYTVRFSAALRRHLAELGFSEEYGARELRRLIKREVEDPLVERIFEGRLRAGSTLSVRLRGGRVVVEAVRGGRSVVQC